jgi:hypothetical protein
LLKDCEIEKKHAQCIYSILANIGSAYSIFVYAFHSTREGVGDAYQPPSLESFFDSLIKEKDNLLHIEVIKT